MAQLCNLCKTNEAMQTGSHIIPSFLMKRVDNVAGSTKRDKELGFAISNVDYKGYFGRDVSPEKLSDVFGEITEEDIENSRSPEIIDYILCPSCEKRFSAIETEYAKTLDANHNDSYTTNVDKNVAFAFWLSIIWRMIISKRHNLKLNSEKQEAMRVILNEYLGRSIEEIKDLSQAVSQNNLFYKLLRSPNYTQNEAGFVFCKDQDCEPLAVIIGEFVLFFYTRSHCRVDKRFSLFGFENYRAQCQNNNLKTGEYVHVINRDNFKKYISRFVSYSSQETIKTYFNKLDIMHRTILKGIGDSMPHFLKVEIIEDMINNNKLGRRHGDKALAASTFKIINKYIHLYPYLVKQ
jgi:hypothetical protein